MITVLLIFLLILALGGTAHVPSGSPRNAVGVAAVIVLIVLVLYVTGAFRGLH